jgi:hypothetical protein
MKKFVLVIPMVLAASVLAILAACGSETPEASTADAGRDGGVCVYTSFKGETVSCPATGSNTSCQWSKDGCNATFCLLDGTLTQEAALCTCRWADSDAGFPDAGPSSGVTHNRTATAPDGCSVCTCKIPPGGSFKGFVLTCDRSACP